MLLGKFNILLLALLVAAMAMVTVVNAAVDETSSTNPAPDIRNIQLPELQFDDNQTKVIVTKELFLDPEVSSLYEKQARESFELIDSEIPYGSIIYHADNGVTTVFDSTGRQLFSAVDEKTTKVRTSGKDLPATYVHEVPSGSMILTDPEEPNITYTFDKGNNLVLTVIDHSGASDRPKSSVSLAAARDTVGCNPAGRCSGWFEYAEDNYIPELTRFEAYWATPGTPLTNNMGEKNRDLQQYSAFRKWFYPTTGP